MQQRRALKRVGSSMKDGNEQGSSAARVSGHVKGSAEGLLPFAIGTEFIREWQGRDHVVVMTRDGLLWSGQTFLSLSAVARAITGTRWNGRRFFGLDRKLRKGVDDG